MQLTHKRFERASSKKTKGRSRKKEVPFLRAEYWAAHQPIERWKRITVRGGEKGLLKVKAIETWVRTKDEHGRIGPRKERLVVIQSIEKNPQTWYVLANASDETALAKIVRAHAERYRIEQLFEEAKGEAGLAHYEVRSWVGWHHHMTLSLLATWFLQLQAKHLGKKNTRYNGSTSTNTFRSPLEATPSYTG